MGAKVTIEKLEQVVRCSYCNIQIRDGDSAWKAKAIDGKGSVYFHLVRGIHQRLCLELGGLLGKM